MRTRRNKEGLSDERRQRTDEFERRMAIWQQRQEQQEQERLKTE